MSIKQFKYSVQPVEEYKHTPVYVLMFGSDPVAGRLYEYGLRQEYCNEKPLYKWSDKRFNAYLKKADKWENECRRKSDPRSLAEYRDPNSPKIYWIEFPTPTALNSRSMGADRVAQEVRKLGYTVQVIHHTDYMSEGLAEQIIKKFVGPETKAVMFGQTFNTQPANIGLLDCIYFPPGRQHKLKEWVKEINPDCKFVIGGAQFNSTEELKGQGDPDSPLQDIDVRMFGYADVTVKQLMKDLEVNNPRPSYSDSKSMHDIENSTQEYFEEDCLLPETQLGLEIGRGCIFKCTFCEFSLIGKEKGTYTRSTSRVEDELRRNWEEFGTKDYWITDDTLNDDSAKLERLAEIRERTNIPFTYTAFARLDLQNRLNQTELLLKSGVKALHYGIETTVPESAIAIGKGWHPDEQFAFIRELKTGPFKDVQLSSNFMFGLPEDSEENLRDSYKKLTDMEYNMLDSIHPVFYKLRDQHVVDSKADSTPNVSDIMEDLDGYGYEILSAEHQKDFEKSLGFKIDMLMYKNKHGITPMRAHYLSLQTKRKFLEVKYFADRPPVTASNKLREQKLKDYNKYWDRVMNIQKHHRYGSVTLFKGDTPITMTIQEYKDSI